MARERDIRQYNPTHARNEIYSILLVVIKRVGTLNEAAHPGTMGEGESCFLGPLSSVLRHCCTGIG